MAKKLKEELGDKLVPIGTDLLSLDGLDDYGKVEDILSIPNIDLYRECRKRIKKIDKWYWLATPDSTPSGFSFDCVYCVCPNGYVDCSWYYNVNGVRPCFVIES